MTILDGIDVAPDTMGWAGSKRAEAVSLGRVQAAELAPCRVARQAASRDALGWWGRAEGLGPTRTESVGEEKLTDRPYQDFEFSQNFATIEKSTNLEWKIK